MSDSAKKSATLHDSASWTGEPDLAAVQSLGIALGLGALGFLILAVVIF